MAKMRLGAYLGVMPNEMHSSRYSRSAAAALPPFGSAERRRRVRGVDGEPHRVVLVDWICGTYREMPGLVLHVGQAARLFGVTPQTCQIVLESLVSSSRMRRTSDGQYALP